MISELKINIMITDLVQSLIIVNLDKNNCR